MRVSINQVQWSPCSFIFYLLKMSKQRQTTSSLPHTNCQDSAKKQNEVQILSSDHFLTLRIKEEAPFSRTLDDLMPDCPQLVKKNRSMDEKEDREISRYLCFELDHRDAMESSITIEDRSVDQQASVVEKADQLEISENSMQQIEEPQKEEIEASVQEMEPQTTANHLCSDYTKNLPAYIIKKAIRLLFNPKSQTHVAKTCLSWGINHQDFRNHYLSALPRLYGPNSIIHLFKPQAGEDPTMKKMFAHLIFKILRGRYMIAVLQEGKMKDLETYIELKNRYLLYFDKLVRK